MQIKTSAAIKHTQLRHLQAGDVFQFSAGAEFCMKLNHTDAYCILRTGQFVNARSLGGSIIHYPDAVLIPGNPG